MMETKADLWAVDADLRVITTNPITRKGDGAAVMGRGCAREAKQRIADLERPRRSYVCQWGWRAVSDPSLAPMRSWPDPPLPGLSRAG